MVKGIYQVFTLGIRFRIWISVCSRADMKDWKLSGWSIKRFHKRRQVVVTTLKLYLFLWISRPVLLFLFFFLMPHSTHAFVRYHCYEWPSLPWSKCFIFKGAGKWQNVKGRRWLTFIVTGLCSGQPYKCRCVDCNKELTFSLWTFYLLTSYFILRLKHLFVLLCSQWTPPEGVIRLEVQSYIKIIKGTWCRKVNFNSAPADKAGRQCKQNGCICFSCENQWAQTDGGLFPHYLLHGSLTNVLAAPSGLMQHR